MGHIDRNLMKGEQVAFRTHLHWIIFLWPLLWLGASLILTTVSWANLGTAPIPAAIEQLPASQQPLAYVAVGSLVLAIATWTLLKRLLARFTTEFAVTNRRFSSKEGLIRRSVHETALPRLEGLDVHQNIFGRLLGYGTIQVIGTGRSKSLGQEAHRSSFGG